MAHPVTHLTLIRHAETDWNRARRLQGHRDIELNAQGLRQADALAQRVCQARQVAARSGVVPWIVASDLTRCRQTAGPLAAALGATLHCDAALRERHFGQFEGRTVAEIERDAPEQAARWLARDPDFNPGGGETLREFAARVQAGLNQWAERCGGGDLIVVTHGGVLDVVYRLARGLDWAVPRTWGVANAVAQTLVWQAGRLEIVHWDDLG